MFNLEAWASQFTSTPESRPSPDFSDPVMAQRLLEDVPRLARASGQHPPPGWAEEDWVAELQLTLILRSRGKGKWDPARGRTTWASWATMVMQTRNLNLWRCATSPKANIVMLCTAGMVEAGYLESWSGEGITIQSGIPRYQRQRKAAQQRLRRAALALD